MDKPWFNEFITNALLVVVFGALVYSLGNAFAGIALGLFIGMFRLYQQLRKYSDWLGRGGRLKEHNQDFGVIDDLHHRTFYLQKRHLEKTQNLGRIIKRFQDSTRAMPDAVIMLNQRNEVEWLNKAAKKLIGLKSNKDVGQNISNLIRHPDFMRYVMREDFNFPIEIPSPINEAIHVRIRIVPYGDNSRLMVIRDITKLTNLENMRQEFIASTSHELRTPLTVITGYLESIHDLKIKDGQNIISAMLNQAHRMESIIKDMLHLTRLESLQKHLERNRKPVQIRPMLDSLQSEAQALGSWTHDIEMDIDPTLNLVANETELYSVFSNLVNNALRYTPTDSKIKVSWQRYKQGARYIVEDNGPGIAQEHLSRLTERFYRVDIDRSRNTGGTGLGLAIVKQIMKQHDGQILIESKQGKGSKFICEFPQHLITGTDNPDLKIVGS